MRGPAVCLRELTAEEASAVDSQARSRTAAARRVERARIVWRASHGETPPSIAETLGLSAETVRRRIRRFNAEGLAALEDHPRSGRPATYSADEVAAVITAALTDPRRLGLPFASWTLDRLAGYLLEHKGIAMRRSRIDEILLKEGLRWRRQETWFGERVDPEFAEKGADRDALHRATRRQPSRLPRRDGAAQRQELSRSGPGAAATATGRPGPAGDRLRPARQGLRLRRLLPRNWRRSHPALPGPWGCQLGRLPGGGRELAAAGHRAGLCHRRQPEQPPWRRRAAVHAGAPALGDGVPAEIRRLPQPDRAVVEGAARARLGGTALRDLGRGHRGHRASHRLLERAPPSLRLGTPPPPAPETRHRAPAQGCMTCRMNH